MDILNQRLNPYSVILCPLPRKKRTFPGEVELELTIHFTPQRLDKRTHRTASCDDKSGALYRHVISASRLLLLDYFHIQFKQKIELPR